MSDSTCFVPRYLCHACRAPSRTTRHAARDMNRSPLVFDLQSSMQSCTVADKAKAAIVVDPTDIVVDSTPTTLEALTACMRSDRAQVDTFACGPSGV